MSAQEWRQDGGDAAEALILIRVLLIEDDPGDAELFHRDLSRATVGRFEVVTANRLATAMARVEEEDMDVIVLDLSLPDSFGIETLKRMREAAPTTPIVVLTGENDERVGLEAVNKGAQEYLVKGALAGHTIARSLLFAIERRIFQDQLMSRDNLLAEAQRIASLGSFDWDIAADNIVWSEELYRIYGVDKTRVEREGSRRGADASINSGGRKRNGSYRSERLAHPLRLERRPN